MPKRTCSVVEDGEPCPAPARTRGWCGKHYQRWLATGDPLGLKYPKTECSDVTCSRRATNLGMCVMHHERWKKHGDTSVVLPRPSGEKHHNWKGDEASYFAAHIRVKMARGRAADLSCVDCGGAAAQWSYRKDAKKRLESEWGMYSTDPADYDPRCVTCHAAYDERAAKMVATWQRKLQES